MSWPHALLGEVAEVVGGATPKTGESKYWGGELPWVTPADLTNVSGPYIAATPRTLTDEGLSSCSARLLPAGSVLLSSRAPIGYVAINTVPMATNQGFKSLIPDRNLLDEKFLYWWLVSNKTPLQRLGVGATFKEISKAIVSRVVVPLPPLAEQRRIASILDHAAQQVDLSRAALSSLIALNLSVYQKTVSGAVGYVRLGDIAQFVRGVTFKPASVVEVSTPGALRFMRTTNVKDELDTVDVKAIAPTVKVRDDQMLRDGDILVSSANSWNLVGRASYVSGLEWTCTFGGFVSVLRTAAAPFSPRFMYSWFMSPEVQSTLRSFGRQTTNISNLNITRTLDLMVPRPTKEASRDFDLRAEEIDSLRAKYRHQLTLTEQLQMSLQARAFRGEL